MGLFRLARFPGLGLTIPSQTLTWLDGAQLEARVTMFSNLKVTYAGELVDYGRASGGLHRRPPVMNLKVGGHKVKLVPKDMGLGFKVAIFVDGKEAKELGH